MGVSITLIASGIIRKLRHRLEVGQTHKGVLPRYVNVTFTEEEVLWLIESLSSALDYRDAK
jgi:hypothetical protein